MNLTPYEYTRYAVCLRGEPIKIGDRRPWLPPIYDIGVTPTPGGAPRRNILLIFARQSEKSTTLGNMLIAYSNLVPYLRSLYVSASDAQMREFSDERLRAVIKGSPIVEAKTGVGGPPGTRETQNVLTKRWDNQSKISLRAVFRDADRVRGIAADLLCCDEIQDIISDHFPVIEETLSNSELDGGPISYYAGTPKTFDKGIEFYWSRHSTQNEWLIRCDGCRKWNCVELENVSPTGLVCSKCSKPIDPVDGTAQWVRTGRADAEWEGFHLPQPIACYAYKNNPQLFEVRWKRLLKKIDRYTPSVLQNEVFARSHDMGVKPITRDELRRCCVSALSFTDTPSKAVRSSHSWAGVDWGGGTTSFTVLSIWQYDPKGCFVCIFAKRYSGRESGMDYAVKDIIKWCRVFSVNIIGADWGFGFQTNPKLLEAFGPKRVLFYQHTGKQKQKVSWNKSAMHFTTHRTRVLQDVFTLIKRGPKAGGCAFPVWDQSETFLADILNVFQEFSDSRREVVYDHPRDKPDDFLHTFCYALLASQLHKQRMDLNAPGAARGKKKRK